ncbi:ATP-binding cassette domain-containing protein [Mycolicibacterium sp. P1-18]|uniref:ATP-binding cassette domain-containing protein n=1 Tax=Mycolicibacterium sp. P1-18 TaxID=2024615 RepID=UPI0011F36504|nr:ATP-binding cassette domain-containing protein [Mycolicibacterium sp. P1-18]KAA0096696.1 ATP-binding cassette domain-containing protein [Mycolicibacterium sp. P1-18]
MVEPDTDDEQPPAIVATAISVAGPWGPVYGPVSLEVPRGGLTVLLAPPGAGRTALLMTLAGRMKSTGGTLRVLGETNVRTVFRRSALAGIEEVDAVYESVTVRDLLTEKMRWDAPWYRVVRRADDADLARACAPVFGALPLPELGSYVDELGELDALLLRVALANTTAPPLLVVGPVDQVAEDASRVALVRRLAELGERQTVVTASANPVPDGLGVRVELPLAQKDGV